MNSQAQASMINENLIDFDQAFMSVFARANDNKPRDKSVAVTQFLDAIQHGQYAEVIAQVRELRAKYNAGEIEKATYQDFKLKNLEAPTPSGTFHPIRVGTNLKEHTGIIIADIDDLDDSEDVKEKLKSDPYVTYAFTSPGGDGLKVGVRVVPCADGKTHGQAWQAIRDYLGACYGLTLDKSGKDVNRLCYVSHDPLVYRKPDAIPLPIPDPEQRPTKPRSVSGLPGHTLNAEASPPPGNGQGPLPLAHEPA